MGVACRMQDHEQKWRPLKERVGYLNPYLINQRAMTFELQKDDAAKLDAITDKKERAKALYDMKKDHNAHFALYIGRALIKYQRRSCIVAPYNFK